MGGSFDIGGALEGVTGALEGLSDAFKGDEGKKLEHISKALEDIRSGVGDLATLQAAFDKEFPEVTRDEAMNEKLQGIFDEIKREVVSQSPEAVALDQYANQILQMAPKKPGLKDTLREWGKNDFFKNFVESLKKDLADNKLGWIGKALAMYVISAVESPPPEGTEQNTATPGSPETPASSSQPASPENPVDGTGATTQEGEAERVKMEAFKASLAENLKAQGDNLKVLELMSGKTEKIEDGSKAVGFVGDLSMARMEMGHKYISENAPEGLIVNIINNQLEVKIGEASPRYFSVSERTTNGLTVNVLTEGNKSAEWNGLLAELPTAIQQLDTAAI